MGGNRGGKRERGVCVKNMTGFVMGVAFSKPGIVMGVQRKRACGILAAAAILGAVGAVVMAVLISVSYGRSSRISSSSNSSNDG